MVLAVRKTLAGYSDGQSSGGIASPLGQQVVLDFYTYMAMIGASFQVRAGTITTPLVGDVVLTDTAAEYCVDAAAGVTIIPVYNNIAIRLGTGTLHEYAVKSVATVSSAGTAFTPLPLKTNGPGLAATPTAAVSTARVSAAGGVTVTAELATTTRRHWAYSNPVAVGAGNDALMLEWAPRMPPILAGAWCCYVQIAATGTGPSYYASLDYIEAPTATLL